MARSTKRVWWHLVALHGDLIAAIGVSRSDMRKKEALHPVPLHGDQIVATDVLRFDIKKKKERYNISRLYLTLQSSPQTFHGQVIFKHFGFIHQLRLWIHVDRQNYI